MSEKIEDLLNLLLHTSGLHLLTSTCLLPKHSSVQQYHFHKLNMCSDVLAFAFTPYFLALQKNYFTHILICKEILESTVSTTMCSTLVVLRVLLAGQKHLKVTHTAKRQMSVNYLWHCWKLIYLYKLIMFRHVL